MWMCWILVTPIFDWPVLECIFLFFCSKAHYRTEKKKKKRFNVQKYVHKRMLTHTHIILSEAISWVSYIIFTSFVWLFLGLNLSRDMTHASQYATKH